MSEVPNNNQDERPQEQYHSIFPGRRASNSSSGMAPLAERLRPNIRPESMREILDAPRCRQPFPRASRLDDGRDLLSSSLPVQSFNCIRCSASDTMCWYRAMLNNIGMFPDTGAYGQQEERGSASAEYLAMSSLPMRTPGEGIQAVAQQGTLMETGNSIDDHPSGYNRPYSKRKSCESDVLDIEDCVDGNEAKRLREEEHIMTMLHDSEVNQNGMGISGAYHLFQEEDHYNPDFPGISASRVLGRNVRLDIGIGLATATVTSDTMEVENDDDDDE